jgi:hypothetical protein
MIPGPPPTVGPGQTARMTAFGRFDDGSERDVTSDAIWTSSQPQIATVDTGLIMGKALGRTVIRAAYSGRSASQTIVVKPEGTFILSGNITEPGPVTVTGATVTIVGNPLNLLIATSGFYELFGVSGTVTVRVSKPGYVDETRTVMVTQDQRLDVEMKPVSAPTPVAGIYRMTLTISASCSVVPDDQKTRVYTATIQQDYARLAVRLSDANFVAQKDTFGGRVFGDSVTLDWGRPSFYSYVEDLTVQEILPSGQVLGIWGAMIAPATPQTISGNLVGGFLTDKIGRACSGSDNSVVLTRK